MKLLYRSNKVTVILWVEDKNIRVEAESKYLYFIFDFFSYPLLFIPFHTTEAQYKDKSFLVLDKLISNTKWWLLDQPHIKILGEVKLIVLLSVNNKTEHLPDLSVCKGLIVYEKGLNIDNLYNEIMVVETLIKEK